MRGWLLTVPTLLFVVLAGCGGEGSAAAEPPCVVSDDEMAAILDRAEVFSAPQNDGVSCIYASDGQPVVGVSVRTPEQFQAERAKFEDAGFKLPELLAVEGFDGTANVDPRYNSLNVTAGNRILSVEIVGVEPSDPAAQLKVEKAVARAALENL